MKRLLCVLVVSFALASCRKAEPPGQQLVTRAVAALGGADALASIKTVQLKGTIREWEPEQSVAADGEPRLASDSTFDRSTDLGTAATRVDWIRNFHYPLPRTYTFSEIVTPNAGYVAGIDATARNKQSLESNPPAHAMSGLRLTATQRELGRTSPLLLLEMSRNPESVSPIADVTVAGVPYPAVTYKAGDQTFTVMFDSQSGVPLRIRSLDYDNIWGDVTFDLVLSDWRPVDKVKVAGTAKYELNGKTIAEIKLTEIKWNVTVAVDRMAIPSTLTASASKAAANAVPYQWVLRRQFIGVYLDSDQPSYDTRASSGLRFSELSPGVLQVVGGTHNSLLVELKDYVVAFDAPVSDWQSNVTLKLAHEKFGAKPIRYLVLTHHHMDHAGGFRAYAAEGATLVVGKGNAEHFRRALAAPFQQNPDLKPRDLGKTEIIEVADKHLFSDGTREVSLYEFDSPHAAGMLFGYVADAKLGWVVDVWSPGRDPLPEKLNPAQAALVAAVKKAGIAPVKFAAGHGSIGDYAPLAALEGK